jgi:xanthine dehydrogenase accessory factor
VRELLPTIERWRAEGVGFGRAVVVRVEGSAPRPVGSTLLVADDGRIAGSVSGGCVEGAAAEEVLRARRGGRSRVVRFGISDEQAHGVGLACGGTIEVLVEPDVEQELVNAAAARDGGVVIAALPGDLASTGASPAVAAAVPSDEEVAAAVERGESRVVTAESGTFWVEVFAPPPRLVIFGAVQVAISLARLARELGYEVVVADARSAFATEERFPDVELVLGWPDEVADRVALRPSDSVAILSHDPKLDEPAILTALRLGCRYVGAIGSRRTQQARRERLLSAGATAEQLERLRAPIGLDLGGRAPAETALAILSEVVAARYGATGAPLRHRVS